MIRDRNAQRRIVTVDMGDNGWQQLAELEDKLINRLSYPKKNRSKVIRRAVAMLHAWIFKGELPEGNSPLLGG